MPLLCLSRTLDPGDYQELQAELKVVDAFDLSAEHPHRRWEYALALHAVGRWTSAGRSLKTGSYHIGNGDEVFAPMLADWTYKDPLTIYPSKQRGNSLGDWCTAGLPLVDLVTCLGVIEKAEDQEQFLYHLSCLLAPGGLLVLTMAYWTRCGADTAVGREQRQRIYCPKIYTQLRQLAQMFHLTTFGGMDPTWHGVQVFDHSVVSLILEKRR